MLLSSPRYSRFFAMLFTTSAALFVLSGCQDMTSNMDNQTIKQPVATVAPSVTAVVGDYVDEGYEKRAQGYDWVGVMIRSEGNEQIDIKVRARSDIKKPTCEFDGQATLMGQDEAHGIIFQSKVNDSMTFFQFKDDTLTIDSQDKYALNYFCSGGSLIGEYKKIDEEIELN